MTRRWLYHADCPQGRIFEGDEQVAAALKEGWVDSPAKIGEAKKPEPPKAEGKDEPAEALKPEQPKPEKAEPAESAAKPKRGAKAD